MDRSKSATFCLLHGVTAYLEKLRRHSLALPKLTANSNELLDGIAALNADVLSLAAEEYKPSDPQSVGDLLKMLALPDRSASEKVQFSKKDIEDMLLNAWYYYQSVKYSLEGGSDSLYDTSSATSSSSVSHYKAEWDPEAKLPIAVMIFISQLFESSPDTDVRTRISKFQSGINEYYNMLSLACPTVNASELQNAFQIGTRANKLKAANGILVPSAQVRVQDLKKKAFKCIKSCKPKALAYYSQALLITPQSHVLLSSRAAMFQELESHEEAIEDLKRAIEISPAFSVAYARIAYSYLHIGNAYESVKNYVKALEAAEGFILPKDIDPQNKFKVQKYMQDVKKKTMPYYTIHIVRSLKLAESRARQQGISNETLRNLKSKVRSVISRYSNRQAPFFGGTASNNNNNTGAARPAPTLAPSEMIISTRTENGTEQTRVSLNDVGQGAANPMEYMEQLMRFSLPTGGATPLGFTGTVVTNGGGVNGANNGAAAATNNGVDGANNAANTATRNVPAAANDFPSNAPATPANAATATSASADSAADPEDIDIADVDPANNAASNGTPNNAANANPDINNMFFSSIGNIANNILGGNEAHAEILDMFNRGLQMARSTVPGAGMPGAAGASTAGTSGASASTAGTSGASATNNTTANNTTTSTTANDNNDQTMHIDDNTSDHALDLD